eukprot:1491385-Rhodomonas_salina.1
MLSWTSVNQSPLLRSRAECEVVEEVAGRRREVQALWFTDLGRGHRCSQGGAPDPRSTQHTFNMPLAGAHHSRRADASERRQDPRRPQQSARGKRHRAQAIVTLPPTASICHTSHTPQVPSSPRTQRMSVESNVRSKRSEHGCVRAEREEADLLLELLG